MSRKVRAFEEALAPRRKEEEGKLLRQDGVWVLTWERTYTLITRLVGGGVEPGKEDPVSVVRATEVRGQLRFWWRALRGWQAEGSLDKLRELESALFGSAGEGGASPVVVEVEVLKEREKADHQNARGVQRDFGSPPRGKGGGAPVEEGVAFRLRLRFPERVKSLNLAEELEAALWAWETFGGIGARTRRGFGALFREGASPPTEEEIREGLGRYSRQGGWPEGVPHLTPQSLVRVVPLSWEELTKRYRAFRQTRSGQSSGHSLWPEFDKLWPEFNELWPEFDEIRHLTGRHAPTRPPRHPVRKFPQAHFGLPIIFRFKDKGDPPKATLKPRRAERRASPLLFRPLGKEQRPCVVAVLEGDRFPGEGLILELVLENGKSRTWEVDPRLTSEEARQIPLLRGQVDPVRAFVESL
jgi:CRISPR-associated protein Cmr1